MCACMKHIIDVELFRQKEFVMNSGNVWWVWWAKTAQTNNNQMIGLQRKPCAHIKTVKIGS